MTQRTSIHGLHVATPLYRFIEDQVLPAVGVKSKTFWSGFDAIVKDLAPVNIALLAERGAWKVSDASSLYAGFKDANELIA